MVSGEIVEPGDSVVVLNRLPESAPSFVINVGSVDEFQARVEASTLDRDADEREDIVANEIVYAPEGIEPEPDYDVEDDDSDVNLVYWRVTEGECCVCRKQVRREQSGMYRLDTALRPFVHQDCLPALQTGLDRVWEYGDELLPETI